MLLAKPITELGDLRGTVYDFEKEGDILEKHVHNESNIHITLVTRGKIKAYSHDWEVLGTPGMLIDFRVGEPHEIMALEDNTRIVNILKHFGGIPNDSLQEQTNEQ